MMETVIAGATDVWPHILRPRKALFTFICCVVGFVLGIPQACKVCHFVRPRMNECYE